MYTCRAPQDQDAEELFGKFTGDHPGHDCFTNTPGGIPREFCTNALYAWSLGGRVLAHEFVCQFSNFQYSDW